MTIKLFAASFSVFCVCFLYSTEAKAHSFGANGRYFRYEQAFSCSERGLRDCGLHLHDSGQDSSITLIPSLSGGFRFFLPVAGLAPACLAFLPPGARDFYFHSGLSPPSLHSC